MISVGHKIHPMNIKTLPLGGAFLEALAQRIYTLTQDDPLGMGGAIILLPTRRACRALELILFENSANPATLLPKILPMGESDPDELIFMEDAEELDLRDTLDPQCYQALLTNLILKFSTVWGADQNQTAIGSAANLALNLMHLLNQVETEGLNFDNLETLVPHEYAEHWQITLDFLKIITDHWPAILKDQGKVTPAALRRHIMQGVADDWVRNPPNHLVIAAGSTGTIPATANLLKVIGSLPRGEVILPGFVKLPEDDTLNLPATHPQYTMHQLLKKLEVTPQEVVDLIPSPSQDALFLEAFGNKQAPFMDTQAFNHIEFAECDHLQEEALVIALKIRETLEQPDKTALLVTPDPSLSMRVVTALKSFGIEVDDSAGRLFSKSPLGAFLRLTALWLQGSPSASLILSTLKHPLAQGPFERSQFLILVRLLEHQVLRKGKIFGSISEMKNWIASHPCPSYIKEDQWDHLCTFLKQSDHIITPLQGYSNQSDIPLPEIISVHQKLLGFLRTGNPDISIEEIFSPNTNETIVAKTFWENWVKAAPLLNLPQTQDYPDLLDSFLSPLLVRPPEGQHPRVSILSPMEARLMSADQVILGGLNEDIWPPTPKGDPWFSMDMREKFGLPPTQRRIGLSAHDFLEHLGAKNVLLTRSLRVNGSPTMPSRFLVKMETLLKPQGANLRKASDLRAWARALHTPETFVNTQKACPKPCPPIASRPMKLSITDVGHLIHNPYDVYAKHVLRLRPLDALDPTPGALEYGIILHEVFHELLADFGSSENLCEKGLNLGNILFDTYFQNTGFQDFWRLKFERSLQWFLENELENDSIKKRYGEVSGTLSFETPEGPFTLICKADRIDLLQDHTWQILDYKTGKLPTQKAIARGHAPQLPLEAAVLKFGKFEGIQGGPIRDLSFISFTGKMPAGEIMTVNGNPEELAEKAFQNLKTLIHHFLYPETPYEAGFNSLSGDYDHLARIHEISFFEGDEV